MPSSIMYQEDGYVVLETNQPEQILSAEELLAKLQTIILTIQDDLPKDVKKFISVEEQAHYLLENYCELDLGVGQYLQWYVIRLEK